MSRIQGSPITGRLLPIWLAALTFYLYPALASAQLDPQASLGADQGIALSLVDRWKGDDDESFRVNQGLSYYFSFTKYALNNQKTRFRWIGSINLLDFDDQQDFEIGVGLGFLFRELANISDGTKSLGLVGGIGYNLMHDVSRERWYTFVGFSMNFSGDDDEEAEDD